MVFLSWQADSLSSAVARMILCPWEGRKNKKAIIDLPSILAEGWRSTQRCLTPLHLSTSLQKEGTKKSLCARILQWQRRKSSHAGFLTCIDTNNQCCQGTFFNARFHKMGIFLRIFLFSVWHYNFGGNTNKFAFFGIFSSWIWHFMLWKTWQHWNNNSPRNTSKLQNQA